MRNWCMIAGLLVSTASGSQAVNRGETGRIAGSGPEGTYYAAKSWQDALACERLGTLQALTSQPGATSWGASPRVRLPRGVTAAQLAKEAAQASAKVAALVKLGRLVKLSYNTTAKVVEETRSYKYRLLQSATKAPPVPDSSAPLTRVEVSDGTLKGQVLFTRSLYAWNDPQKDDIAFLGQDGREEPVYATFDEILCSLVEEKAPPDEKEKRDLDARNAYVEVGHALKLEKNTTGRIIQKEPSFSMLAITSGDHTGERIWVQTRFLQLRPCR